MKTWRQLEDMARADKLELLITKTITTHCVSGVTVYSTSVLRSPMFTIRADDLTDEEGDAVIRRTLETALRALRDLNP